MTPARRAGCSRARRRSPRPSPRCSRPRSSGRRRPASTGPRTRTSARSCSSTASRSGTTSGTRAATRSSPTASSTTRSPRSSGSACSRSRRSRRARSRSARSCSASGDRLAPREPLVRRPLGGHRRLRRIPVRAGLLVRAARALGAAGAQARPVRGVRAPDARGEPARLRAPRRRSCRCGARAPDAPRRAVRSPPSPSAAPPSSCSSGSSATAAASRSRRCSSRRRCSSAGPAWCSRAGCPRPGCCAASSGSTSPSARRVRRAVRGRLEHRAPPLPRAAARVPRRRAARAGGRCGSSFPSRARRRSGTRRRSSRRSRARAPTPRRRPRTGSPRSRYLHAHLSPSYRVEAVDTAEHWPAAYLPDAGIPIVRGWYRQSDFPQNELLYDSKLAAARTARGSGSMASATSSSPTPGRLQLPRAKQR